MTESDIRIMTSQELEYVMENEGIQAIVNGNMGILDEDEIPDQYSHIPCNEDWPGIFNFETSITPHAAKNWMYSPMLNKIFIISHSDFPVDFKWDIPDCKENLYVRAMPLYNLSHDAHKPVVRCIQHSQPNDISNVGLTEFQRKHILRCMNDAAEYHGGATRHLSVITPLTQPQSGMDAVRLMFKFFCKNSCATGMNRRPIDVIFTLEDSIGEVYGRRRLGVRICSCPKRDKQKEEAEYLKLQSGTPIRGKKRKIISKKPSSLSGNTDNGVYTIKGGIVGKQNAKKIAEFAQALMAKEMLNRQTDEPYKTYFSEWANILKSYDSDIPEHPRS